MISHTNAELSAEFPCPALSVAQSSGLLSQIEKTESNRGVFLTEREKILCLNKTLRCESDFHF